MSFLISRANNCMVMYEQAVELYQDDDEFLRDVCYQLQQALEYYLEAILQTHSVTCPPTHKVDVLYAIICKNKLKLPTDVCSVITNYSSELNSWSADTYNDDFIANLDLVNLVVKSCYVLKAFIEQETLCDGCTDDAIAWCRNNAPEVAKGLPDIDLWDLMKDTYYRLKKL